MPFSHMPYSHMPYSHGLPHPPTEEHWRNASGTRARMDGSVTFIAAKIDPQELAAMFTRSGND